jgi:hypothetical protein
MNDMGLYYIESENKQFHLHQKSGAVVARIVLYLHYARESECYICFLWAWAHGISQFVKKQTIVYAKRVSETLKDALQPKKQSRGGM